VADDVTDLTPLLQRLSDDGMRIDAVCPTDEIKRPVIERARHPRAGDALVTLLKDKSALSSSHLREEPVAVMPKGRNFH
jgi:hypothetical protein